jgi:hypothetical protein
MECYIQCTRAACTATVNPIIGRITCSDVSSSARDTVVNQHTAPAPERNDVNGAEIVKTRSIRTSKHQSDVR